MTAQLNQLRVLMNRAAMALPFMQTKKGGQVQLSALPDHVLRDIGYHCEGRCPRGEHVR